MLVFFSFQGFDKATYGGTPPPPFSIAMPVGTQPGNPAAGGAMYSGAYVPVLQHQTHSQMMHHAMVPNQVCFGSLILVGRSRLLTS